RLRRAGVFEYLQSVFESGQAYAAGFAHHTFGILLGQREWRGLSRRYFGKKAIRSGLKLGRGRGFLFCRLGSDRFLFPLRDGLPPESRRGDKASLILRRSLLVRFRRGAVPGLQMCPALGDRF